MTKACEKLFNKLSMVEQKAVLERIEDIKRDPSSGTKLQDKDLEGSLHTHCRGKRSNLLIIWSHDQKSKRIWIEAVGPHKIIDWLARRKKILEENR